MVTPILLKQQSTQPTSMRYQRVQAILENDQWFKTRLGPRNQSIDDRFGEKLLFSKEAIDVTNSIHAEGRDAHKIPKNDILRAAMRSMKVASGNGEHSNGSETTKHDPATNGKSEPAPKAKTKPKAAKVPKTKPDVPASPAPERQESKPEPKKQPAPAPKKSAKPKAKAKQPPPTAKTAPVAKAAPVPKTSAPEESKAAKAKQEEPEVPESELPPESQPLRLPIAYDPTKYPHYDVQRAIYSMLLSAMSLSEHFEKLPGYEGRQKKLEALSKEYLDTCDAINIGS